MAHFTDKITIYQKRNGSYNRTVVDGVQWSDTTDKTLATGRLTTAKSATVTFPEAVLNLVDFSTFTEEDAIFLESLTMRSQQKRGTGSPICSQLIRRAASSGA